ncbi:MAG TPA: DUF222 domain-containing protein [Streptosporangiaceae bacterium]
MVSAGLSYLASCDAAELPTAVQAETLIGLERAEAVHTAARAKVLAAFTAQNGYEADAAFGPKTWLRAQTKVTPGAAAGAVAWASRLQAHRVMATALAHGEITASWARQICQWTDQLPEDHRADADQILLGAATGGATLRDLAGLAREMIERAGSGQDGDDGGFGDRALWLQTTLGGAGTVRGELTGRCAAALAVVLDALGKKRGPEDTRSAPQRRHDALEDACDRLIRAGMIPSRDGQPPQVQVHVDLATLRGLPGASAAEASWTSARSAAAGVPGAVWLTGPDAEAASCGAAIVPVITSHLDWTALADLDDLADLWLNTRHGDGPGQPIGPDAPAGPAHPDAVAPADQPHLRATLLRAATDVLSGPGGLASHLRGRLLGRPFTGLSQPLDIGRATRVIPPQLHRALTIRDRHCQFPGCDQPPPVCEAHHLTPWAQGGPTSLDNLALLCRFHHLIAVHRWGWTLTRSRDGTTTATNPDGRSLHSHRARAA